MTKNSDLLLALEQYFDSSRNWNLYRRYTASLTTRIEGFTERWGDSNPPDSNLSVAECWQAEQESVASICASEFPQAPLRIFQYRPAWLEQLALRIAGLPHVVVNSNYACTEATGPLPFIQDFGSSPPAMTGRLHPQSQDGFNAILDYLKVCHRFDLDHQLSSKQDAESVLYKTIIQEKLNALLVVLRFQDDTAWDQINRPRCIKAGTRSFLGNLSAKLQARSERRYELSHLSSKYRSLSTEQATAMARKTYQGLENVLLDNETGFLLKTPKPSLVDVMLWAHLMDALTDIHLVVVLADFPLLLDFVQMTWKKYFAANDDTALKDWEMWNAQQNAINEFSQVPSLINRPNDRLGKDSMDFHHAVDLMEHLSVRDRNLTESLIVAKEARSLQQVQSLQRPFDTWHRWRLGGTLFPQSDGKDQQQQPGETQEEKVRREYKQNDETWIASVALGTTVAVVLFGLGGRQQQ